MASEHPKVFMQEASAQTHFTIAVLSETYLKAEFTQPEWAVAFAQDPTGARDGEEIREIRRFENRMVKWPRFCRENA